MMEKPNLSTHAEESTHATFGPTSSICCCDRGVIAATAVRAQGNNDHQPNKLILMFPKQSEEPAVMSSHADLCDVPTCATDYEP